jgi:hypothetical protein
MDAKSGIKKLQMDFSCDLKCEGCERFFQCKNPERLKIFDRRRMSRAKKTMAKIKRKIAVCAGKGGVGKSMVTSNLAAALAMAMKKVAVMDSDFDGSCIPRMLGTLGKQLNLTPQGIEPVEGLLGIKVVVPYRYIFVFFVFTGAVIKLDLVWSIGTIANACMALPNLVGLIALSGVVGAIAVNRKSSS